ncbi:MAG: hypothetical protein ACPKQO_03670 [Nitrososphaeraceae archaeon]
MESELHLLSAIASFLAALIPIYFTIKLKGYLRILSIVLAIFIIFHGIYHMIDYYKYEVIADVIFLPISIIILIIFGILLLNMPNKNSNKNNENKIEIKKDE